MKHHLFELGEEDGGVVEVIISQHVLHMLHARSGGGEEFEGERLSGKIVKSSGS